MKKKTLFFIASLTMALYTPLIGYATEDAADPATVITGYLVENPADYVTVGNYSDMDVEKPVYTVTEGALQLAIENLLYENTYPQDVDRPAQDGDTVVIDVSASVDGEGDLSFSEADYSYELGYQDFGEEFDQQLAGAVEGDQKSFSCSYDEQFEYADWAGKTLDFDVTVKKVQETIVPEYDETFIRETMDFDSREELEASVEEDLLASYEQQADSEVRENVITDVMDISTFDGYPQELYDASSQLFRDSYESFAAAFGMTMDELFELYGLSEEELEEDVIDMVNRRIFISAICQAENIQVTEGEYSDYIDELAAQMGYETPEALIEDYSREELVWYLYEDRTAALLLERVNLVDVIAPMDSGMDAYDAFEEDPDAEELDGFSDDDDWDYDEDEEYGEDDDYAEYDDDDFDYDYAYDYEDEYDDFGDFDDFDYDDDEFEIEFSSEFQDEDSAS